MFVFMNGVGPSMFLQFPGIQAIDKVIALFLKCCPALFPFPIRQLMHAVYRLVGLVVKASASRAEGSGFDSRMSRDFFGVESYQ